MHNRHQHWQQSIICHPAFATAYALGLSKHVVLNLYDTRPKYQRSCVQASTCRRDTQTAILAAAAAKQAVSLVAAAAHSAPSVAGSG
jgi:hypothetical protein